MPKIIAVIDNEEAIRRTLKKILELQIQDCVIHTFDSGEALLVAMENNGFRANMYLIDNNMGTEPMHGPDAAKLVVKLHPDAVIIGCTADSDDQTTARFLRNGAAAVVHKPFTIAELTGTVLKYLK